VDPTSLEQLRRKVEAGEPLTDAELEALRSAAQGTPAASSAWKVPITWPNWVRVLM